MSDPASARARLARLFSDVDLAIGREGDPTRHQALVDARAAVVADLVAASEKAMIDLQAALDASLTRERQIYQREMASLDKPDPPEASPAPAASAPAGPRAPMRLSPKIPRAPVPAPAPNPAPVSDRDAAALARMDQMSADADGGARTPDGIGVAAQPPTPAATAPRGPVAPMRVPPMAKQVLGRDVRVYDGQNRLVKTMPAGSQKPTGLLPTDLEIPL